MEKKCKKCDTTENVNFDGMCKKCYEDSIEVHEKMDDEVKYDKNFYKEWWFWVLIIFLLVIICSPKDNSKKSMSTSSNIINNVNSNITKNEKTKEVTNPYKIINDFDGVYKFVLNSNNGSGHIFTAKGAISFNNGICEVKCTIGSDTIIDSTRKYKGFCGLNEKDDSNFYFSLNDNEILYKCNIVDKNMSCELKSQYDLCGCSNNELNLTFADTLQILDNIYLQVQEEERIKKEEEEKARKEQEEKEFKESCQVYTYEQMARNPDNFKGTNVKVTGEVMQALYGTNTVDLRVNITKKGSYSTYYTDTIYVTYTPATGEDKILEDDIITIYGTSQGDYSYTSTIGKPITLPLILGKYITIEK